MAHPRLCSAGTSLAVVLATSLCLDCSSPSQPPGVPATAPLANLLTRTAPAEPPALTFPPADEARRARPPLPPELAAPSADSKLAVAGPELDGSGAFTIEGQTLRITFNQPVVLPIAQKKPGSKQKRAPDPAPAAGTITIAPAVAGTARWAGDRALEFTAAAPFDPAKTYEVAIAGVRAAASGKALEATWKGTFKATPSVSIGGKNISYIPKPGAPRVVAVHPGSDETIGRAQVMSALFDQPIDLVTARGLVTLTRDRDKAIPVVVEHPAGPTFQGIKVDPRLVILIRPAAALAAGETVRLTVRDRDPDGAAHTHRLDVASPLEHTGVACGYGADVCSFDGKRTLRTSDRSVRLTFNNPIATSDKALAQRVQVTPAVKNLSVSRYGWGDGTVEIRGAFESSKRYQVLISGLEDRFGGRLAAPVGLTVETLPLPASAVMAEGLLPLDEATTKRFAITTRNVAEAEISAWPVPPGDPAAFQAALAKARAHRLPEEPAPIKIAVPIKAEHDRLLTTSVDLSSKLAAGTSYLATITAAKIAFGAAPPSYPRGSEASKAPVALLTPGDARSLAVHTRELSNGLLVHVARLGSGEPVSGASVGLDGDEVNRAIATDTRGVALLPRPGEGERLLRVRSGDVERMLPLGSGPAAKDLFPDLASGEAATASGTRALLVTDRGIYRPGSTVWIKASLRKQGGDRMPPIAGAKVRLRIVGPTGAEASSAELTTDDMGSVATRFDVPADAKLGRWQLRLEDPDHADSPLDTAILQIAEFEAPRFAVDVDPGPRDEPGAKAPHLRALVRGRYLFGAPMEKGSVKWTLRRAEARLPSGALTDRGLVFRRVRRWYEERDTAWSRAGEGTLDAAGTLLVDQAIAIDPSLGPQEFELEADVSDGSFRHVAGRTAITVHAAKRYAGLKMPAAWIGVREPVKVELGVVGADGRAVSGAQITAKLERVEWRWIQRRGAGGAIRREWTAVRTEAGRCVAQSAPAPVACALTAPRSGEYEVTAEVDGRRGGSVSTWAYRDGDDDDGGGAAASPAKGRVLEIVTDKPRYAPGDVAKLLVRNPFPAATAILTIEQGGLLEHRASRVPRGASLIDVPLSAGHAPHVHATVTLLPIGEKGEAIAESRIGAVRLPVSLDGARLGVALRTDRAEYRPGQEAEITVEVKDGGKPEARAEIALAVVDEGVLRLTGFHARDPAAALRPGRALDFRIRDSRSALAALFERSHVAGDGAGNGGTATIGQARKNFVETALWRPDLRTDAAGRATVKLTLPDNLTQFRIMAVVLDDEGKGAAAESSFTVNKQVMAIPVVPRFAALGDKLEVAAMLHNNGAAPLAATVSFGAERASVNVSPGGHTRVAFPFTASAEGEQVLAFAVEDAGGRVLDRVESKLRVEDPGLDERPQISGAFSRAQRIALEIPADARGRDVTVLAGQHLFPELGERLGYLLDYPHGCVEQTTSSTLPLLAARTILPRIGFSRMSDAELRVRIKAGVDRLATMRTPGGGLAYWPGGGEPNVFGTAYAIRAVILAKQAGIELPRGLLEGMQEYLAGELLSRSIGPEVQAAIAESLAELGALPAGSADALWDARVGSSVFGKASLAMALRAAGGQDDRVQALVAEIEASFDAEGKLLVPPRGSDFHYYGSPTRSRAQAAIALARLKRTAPVLPRLLKDLVEGTEHYTTQATAFSLLAIAEHLSGAAADGAKVTVTLDGAPIEAARDLGFGSREYRIPFASLRGKKAALALASDGGTVGFLVSSRWRRPLSATGDREATVSANGPAVYRAYTDAKGRPVDLARVRAGDVLRVAVLVSLPDNVSHERRGYLAVTDRLPAGFEPIQPDLATVAKVPEIDGRHPFASVLRGGGSSASHVELHDDRVDLYFDETSGDAVAATYLVRASTPGDFALPPAVSELMYEPGSVGWSDAGRVAIR